MIQASTNIPRTYKGSRPYQVCTRCVMDTSDPNIRFDENGVCNHCHEYAEKEARLVFKGEAGQKRLEETIADIKARGKGKEYDCILGLSGGVDSSYVALKAKEYGLRPLVVHYDNGWNSELAVSNIKNIVANLGFDLYTLVVNWEEFRDLQLAYLRASVIDIEVPTDHAIIATMFRLARKHKIAYTLPGGNVVTEGILPKAWIFRKTDHANLRAIHKAHGTTPLKTYPQYSFLEFLKSYHLHRVRPFAILNCLPYHKDEAKAELAEKLNWRDYGGKHYESVFTKFYQAYILPEKFGVDKRRAHLSSLINSGQMSREVAVAELEQPLYPANELRADREYVIKKFGLTEAEFEEIMQTPPRSHREFASDDAKRDTYARSLQRIKSLIGRK